MTTISTAMAAIDTYPIAEWGIRVIAFGFAVLAIYAWLKVTDYFLCGAASDRERGPDETSRLPAAPTGPNRGFSDTAAKGLNSNRQQVSTWPRA